MNCLEIRQEFPLFWRKTLAPERRQAFLAHLRECQGCDRAFRAFALTAPLLHRDVSSIAPAARPLALGTGALRGGSMRPAAPARGRWRATSTAAAMVVAASLAAYLSIASPSQTLQQALLPQQTDVSQQTELIGQLQPLSGDVDNTFAG